jgi:hypothetical protein
MARFSHARTRPVAAVVSGFVLTVAFLAPVPFVGAATHRSPADTAARVLLQQAKAVPRADFSPIDERGAFLKSVRTVHTDAAHGDGCMTLTALAHVTLMLQSTPGVPPLLPATDSHALEAQIETVTAAVLGDGTAAACGGASTAASPVAAPITTLASSDNQQVTMHVAFPSPIFAPKTDDNGNDYFEMTGPAEGNGGEVGIGAPEVPLASETIAVPIGATPSVQVLGVSSYQLPAVQLWPLQPPAPMDATDGLAGGIPPFTIDPAAYATDALTPAQVTNLSAITSQRDLNMVTLRLAAGRYNPVQQSLTVITGMDVQVTFGTDATATFGTTDLTSPWNTPFESIYQSSVVNWGTVANYLSAPSFTHQACGEEMMVITDTALDPDAETFAADRTAHGVSSRVFLVDGPDGIGPSPIAIRNKIAQEVESQCVTRPSFVTLFGNTKAVPTWELSMPKDSVPENPIASDQPYGMIHQAPAIDAGIYSDLRTDLLVGRMPADENVLLQATNEADNINRYEDTPPTAGHFCKHVTGEEFFQPCADPGCNSKVPNVPETPSTQDQIGTLLPSEIALEAAATAGKSADRIANDEGNADAHWPLTINPQTMDNGQPVPKNVNWSGGSNDTTNAINAGTFLLWSSTHGYSDGSGWYLPGFSSSSITPSTFNTARLDGQNPVIWNINCDVGKFDAPNATQFPGVAPINGSGVSMTEKWLETDVAVGAVAASRESSAYWARLNLETMAKAVFPEEGNFWRALFNLPPLQPVLQLGALLNTVDDDVIARADMPNDPGAQAAVLEYNLMGDPSLIMYRSNPIGTKTVPLNGVLQSALDVSLSTSSRANGATITLVKDGQYIGRGFVVNGAADIPTVVSLPDLTGVQAIISGDTYVPTERTF